MLCFHAFLIVEATYITSAKPSLIIGLLEAIKVAAAMRRVHPHALSGGCRPSLAGDFGIIATVRDNAGASSSMPREEASVKHSQLAFWCRYVGGELAHRAMEASEGHLTASPVLHCPWPATSPSIDQAGSNPTLGPPAAPSLTQAWCVLTRSGQVDSRASRRQPRQRPLVPPAVGVPSESDFQAGEEARKKMNLVWAWDKAQGPILCLVLDLGLGW